MTTPMEAINKKSNSNHKVLKFIGELGDDDTKLRIFR
jgi:hypothetical protein